MLHSSYVVDIKKRNKALSHTRSGFSGGLRAACLSHEAAIVDAIDDR